MIDWARIDWADGVKDLARAVELGVSETMVARRRRAAGHARDIRRGIDWSAVDLTKGTRALAREYGVRISTVQAARKARGVVDYAGKRVRHA